MSIHSQISFTLLSQYVSLSVWLTVVCMSDERKSGKRVREGKELSMTWKESEWLTEHRYSLTSMSATLSFPILRQDVNAWKSSSKLVPASKYIYLHAGLMHKKSEFTGKWVARGKHTKTKWRERWWRDAVETELHLIWSTPLTDCNSLLMQFSLNNSKSQNRGWWCGDASDKLSLYLYYCLNWKTIQIPPVDAQDSTWKNAYCVSQQRKDNFSSFFIHSNFDLYICCCTAASAGGKEVWEEETKQITGMQWSSVEQSVAATAGDR